MWVRKSPGRRESESPTHISLIQVLLGPILTRKFGTVSSSNLVNRSSNIFRWPAFELGCVTDTLKLCVRAVNEHMWGGGYELGTSLTMIDGSEKSHIIQRKGRRDRLVGYLSFDERDRDIALTTWKKMCYDGVWKGCVRGCVRGGFMRGC